MSREGGGNFLHECVTECVAGLPFSRVVSPHIQAAPESFPSQGARSAGSPCVPPMLQARPPSVDGVDRMLRCAVACTLAMDMSIFTPLQRAAHRGMPVGAAARLVPQRHDH